jgi:hypothetical protein
MRSWLAVLDQGLARGAEAIYRVFRDAVPDFKGAYNRDQSRLISYRV